MGWKTALEREARHAATTAGLRLEDTAQEPVAGTMAGAGSTSRSSARSARDAPAECGAWDFQPAAVFADRTGAWARGAMQTAHMAASNSTTGPAEPMAAG